MALRPYLDKQFGFFPDGRQPEWISDFRHIADTPIGALFAGDNLPVDLVEQDGKLVGIWLGWPIDLAPQHPVETPGDAVENNVFSNGGSWLYVDFSQDEPRVFLDASGSLCLVFDRRCGIVASTTWVALGPQQYESRYMPAQLETYDVERRGWITGGETAHEDVERVMANFCLYPLSGRIERHWAIGDWDVGGDDASHIAAIGDECRHTLHAAMDWGPAAQTLTAGNESRMLLACLGDRAPEAHLFTVRDRSTAMDTEVSAILAQRFGLSWTPLDVVAATPDQRRRWRMSVSECLTGANLVQHPTMDALGSMTFIGGLGGEIGRAALWRNERGNDLSPTPRGLAERMHFPLSPQIERNMERWLATIPPGIDPIAVYELAYIELKMSCCWLAQSYVNPAMPMIAPLISRSIFTHMLHLGHDMRRRQAMPAEVIRRMWPELLEVPINRYGDWRDIRDKAAKVYYFARNKLMR